MDEASRKFRHAQGEIARLQDEEGTVEEPEKRKEVSQRLRELKVVVREEAAKLEELSPTKKKESAEPGEAQEEADDVVLQAFSPRQPSEKNPTEIAGTSGKW